MNKKKKYIALDLFSGCGGLTTGLKQAGVAVLGAVELDKLAGETYMMNHKGVKLWNSDIRKLDAKEVREQLGVRKGELTILAGCPPCQGFSRMTTYNGSYVVDDPRNALINDYFRFVDEFRPKVVMMENVPGLAQTRRFSSFIRKLENLGYKIATEIVDAADYGVPQRRKRLILLATRKQFRGFPEPAARKKTVRGALRILQRADYQDPLHNYLSARSKQVSELIKLIPKDGGSRSDLPKRFALKCHSKTDGFRDIYGRMAWADVAPTITSGCINPSKGRFLHPEEDRAITLREAALLQGFPLRYKFSLVRGRYKVAEMIGNAIPPPMVRAHTEWLLNEFIRPNGA
ncbi:MAG TPA: DNA cytosine methyltransferase [Gammaproteobacteria bacterium]